MVEPEKKKVVKETESKKSGMTLTLTSIDDKGVATTDTFNVGGKPSLFKAQGKIIRINNVK